MHTLTRSKRQNGAKQELSGKARCVDHEGTKNHEDLILGYSIIFTAPGVFAPPYINAEPHTKSLSHHSRSLSEVEVPAKLQKFKYIFNFTTTGACAGGGSAVSCFAMIV